MWLVLLLLPLAACASTPTHKPCETLKNTLCPMVYAPVACSANTLHGGKEKIAPLKALGGNSCQGSLNIKKAACLKGIDPAAFGEEDIRCQMDDPK